MDIVSLKAQSWAPDIYPERIRLIPLVLLALTGVVG